MASDKWQEMLEAVTVNDRAGPAKDFGRIWAASVAKGKREEALWIERLRADGIKAAHPDDGWIDRDEDSVFFSYPQFNDGVRVGDRIALGSPRKYRVVEVVGQKEAGFIPMGPRWLFRAVEQNHDTDD